MNKIWQIKFCICWCVRLGQFGPNFLLSSWESQQICPKWQFLAKLLWIPSLPKKPDMDCKIMCQWDDWRKGSSALSPQATFPNSERERERERREGEGRERQTETETDRDRDRDGETERDTQRELKCLFNCFLKSTDGKVLNHVIPVMPPLSVKIFLNLTFFE